MSFIGSILGAGARLLGFGGARAATGAAAGAAAGAGTGFFGGLARLFGGAARTVLPIAAGTALGGLLAGGVGGRAAALAAPGGLVGGNGRETTITTVQTIDNATGEVIRQRQLRGSPFLMNSDIAVAKRVFRTANKLHGRLPKRTVRQSQAAMFKDAVMQKAMDTVICPPPCPPIVKAC